MKTNTKLIIGISVACFTAATVFLVYKKKKAKKVEAPEVVSEAVGDVLSEDDTDTPDEAYEAVDGVLGPQEALVVDENGENVEVERDPRLIMEEMQDAGDYDEPDYEDIEEEVVKKSSTVSEAAEKMDTAFKNLSNALGYRDENGEEVAEEEPENNDAWEMEELRYEPNSQEALEQYKQMLVRDITNDETKQTLLKLMDYEYKFTPGTMDENVYLDFIATRVEFFGENSKWAHFVSVAELFLHYAKWLDYDVNGGINKYATILLTNAGLDSMMGEASFQRQVDLLLSHELYTKHGYGMFGLQPRDGDAYMAKTYQEQYHGSYFLRFDNVGPFGAVEDLDADDETNGCTFRVIEDEVYDDEDE